MILFKESVNPIDVHPAMWVAIGIAYNIRRRYTSAPMTITSLNDGTHGSNSLHYPDNSNSNLAQAGDIRTLDIPVATRYAWAREVSGTLNPLGYDVVHHTGTDGLTPHLHIEYQPKANEPDWLRSKLEIKT